MGARERENGGVGVVGGEPLGFGRWGVMEGLGGLARLDGQLG